MRLIFRPIDEWPAPFTAYRQTPKFSATWSDTLQVLERELTYLGAQEAVIQVQLTNARCGSTADCVLTRRSSTQA
jgi:hypothetical protein